MNKDAMFSSKTDLWETPQDFFDALDREFHFETDVCALPENAKCAHYYTPEQDGLKQEWGGMLLVQPALWPRDWEMGEESRGIQRYSSNATPRADGHPLVSRLYLRES